MQRIGGSFRDPCGQVFDSEGRIVRTVHALYQQDWAAVFASGFAARLAAGGKQVRFTEIEPVPGSWKSLEAECIACITYPYEWCFSQHKDAALLTLALQREALQEGLSLKDASAYNVQFKGSVPVFIDLLSFEKRIEHQAWQAYRQFCMHFLAPLAISREDARLGRVSALWIDGIPLDIAWSLLSWRKHIAVGLQLHLHLHAAAEKKYQDGRKAAKAVRETKLSKQSLLDLVDSLENTVKSLASPTKAGEWSTYYSDTNYTNQAEAAKKQLVERFASAHNGKLAIDLGANTGRYSELLAQHFEQVLAVDLDPVAVEQHYQVRSREGNTRILPLVLDLANPSPGIGWASSERDAFAARWQADCVTALALTHHLYFSNRIPWQEQAAFFAGLLKPGGKLLMEFVPREDSQVERLLAARDDVFADYTLQACQQAYAEHFVCEGVFAIEGSLRHLCVFTKSS